MHHEAIRIAGPVTTMSGVVDQLYWFLVFLTVLTSGLIIFLMLFFAVKYRRRPGHEVSHVVIEKTGLIEAIWIGVPLIVFLVIFFWGAKIYFQQMQVPAGALPIYCVAKQWMWKFQHPEGKREINELHIPIGVPIQVTLISQDVIHSFFVPAFRTKMDVLPNRYTNLWFQVNQPGEYKIFCSEYCGLWHSLMQGKVIAMTLDEYESWVDRGKKEPMALKGEQLIAKYGCWQCHQRGSTIASPIFDGLYGGKVHLSDGRTIVADETYIRESIVDPGRRLVAGYANVMPTFKDQISEEEILQLIAFIKSLGVSPGPASSEKTP